MPEAMRGPPSSRSTPRSDPGIRYVAYKECATWPMLAPRHAGILPFRSDKGRKRARKVQDPHTPGPHSLLCPFCEVYELEPSGNNTARCPSCGALLGGPLLDTLRQITELPLVIGRHACECGHPEMRRLPDGVYRCPACASEVTPVSRSS